MTWSTNISTVMEQILMLSGTESHTTFATETQTIWISSEHFGVRNAELQLKTMSIRYVPCPGGSIRVSYRTDQNTTNGFSMNLNPYSEAYLGSFTLGSDSLVSKDRIYVGHHELVGAGKVAEFTITDRSEVDHHIVGIEVEAGFSEAAAYVGGVA